MKRLLSPLVALVAAFGLSPSLWADSQAGQLIPKARSTGESIGKVTDNPHRLQGPEVAPRRMANRFAIPAPAPRRAIRAPKALPANIPTIYGGILDSSNPAWSVETSGVYTIPNGQQTTFTQMFRGAEGQNLGGGVCDGTTYYSVRHFEFYGMSYDQVYFYDPETWEYSTMKTLDRSMLATDLTYDPVTENIYGCFYSNDSDNFYFGVANYREATRSTICQVPKWSGIASDSKGQLYALDMEGNLLKVDKSSGETTLVGPTGVTPRYLTSATFDFRSGLIYWTVLTEDVKGYLYVVDPLTAEAELVTQFPYNEQVNGLWIPAPEADDNAPDVVTGLTLNFPEGSLSGSVDFTAPSLTFGGSQLAGNITYTVAVNNLAPVVGTATPGAAVSVPITLPAAGEYNFAVSTSNDAGNSPKTKLSAFIGNGIPSTPEVTASYADGKFTVAWDPVTESANGGYINPQEVLYTVTLLPTGDVFTTSFTSLEIPLEEPESITSYLFTVVAGFGGFESAAGVSPNIVLGAIVPPFTEDFASAASFDAFTLVDGNNDGKNWRYNSTEQLAEAYYCYDDADDWLITPPVKLLAGYEYRISFDLHCYGDSYPERVEVAVGKDASASAMSTNLMAPTEITNSDPVTHYVYFTPEADGKYYFGFHHISDPNQFYLKLNNISFATGISPLAPAAPENLKAVADFSGGSSATITLTAPALNLSGTALDRISSLELRRNGEVIHTFPNPSPGQELSFVDTDVPTGSHTYSAAAFRTTSDGEAEEGKEAVATTFVGINIPSAPANVQLTETEEGTVTLTWEPPATDKDGNPINPQFITYTIFDVDDEPIAEGLTGNSFTELVTIPGDQVFSRYSVAAVSEAGSSEAVYSALIPVGTPYPLPFLDSFNEDFGGIWGITRIEGYASWSVAVDYEYAGMVSQDNDDAFLAMSASYPGDCGAAYTGKIAITGAVDPSLSFYVYRFFNEEGTCDDTNTLEVQVRDITAGGDYTTVATIVNNELENDIEGWTRVIVPLQAFQGHTIQLRFKVTILSYQVYAIDNITVGDLIPHDLSLVSLTVPEKVKPGQEFEVSALVSNLGTEDASGATVEFFRNGTAFATLPVGDLPAGRSIAVKTPETLSILSGDAIDYSAIVHYPADLNPDNNLREEAYLTLVLPDYPTVSGLQGELTDEGIALSWTPVDLAAIPASRIIDSFEEYEPFTTANPGEWVLIDRDGGATGMLENIASGELFRGMQLAYTVMDSEHANLNGTFAAATGTRYLAAFYNNDLSANDDWAISPRLSGKAQTITFKAKSYNTGYGVEEFEVLYSTGSLNPDDFILIERHQERTGSWQEFAAQLPEGALYAAIRYVGDYQYMFFVDDFAYDPAPLAERLAHVGYHLYRDGQRLSDTHLAEPAFLDNPADDEMHTYHVTALYDKGESAPSEALVIRSSALTSISATPLTIHAGKGEIAIEGCAGASITILTPAGLTISSYTDAHDAIRVAVPAGIYLVAVDGAVTKLTVR